MRDWQVGAGLPCARAALVAGTHTHANRVATGASRACVLFAYVIYRQMPCRRAHLFSAL